MKMNWKFIFSLSFMIAANLAFAQNSKLELNACHLDGIKTQVQCGLLEVPENYSKPDGTKIKINFAVLPAIDNSAQREPLMFLAGGPGQAAVEIAAGLRRVFKNIRKTRDLILIDQRGTGASHPLQCSEALSQDPYHLIPEEFSAKDITECISGLKGDLSQYNSENAIRDFDAVRSALGHAKVNLYGGSYGTRAGLVYMRMFPDSIRSVVLDSVGPIEVPIGLFGQSAARSFELLLENCRKETACLQAYPNLVHEFNTVVERLSEKTVSVNIPHPRLGTQTEFNISLSKFISNLRLQLYSVDTRTLVPLFIHQAYLGNYLPIAGITAQSENSSAMYLGLTFNIVCNEDFPKISPQDFINDANNSFGQADSHLGFAVACPLWPSYKVATEFYQPVTADIPTLILSGNLDPVTPPSNGDKSANTLPNSHHIVVENASHTVAMSTCAVNLIEEFLTNLTPDKLDESCLADIPQESFMTSLNGSI